MASPRNTTLPAITSTLPISEPQPGPLLHPSIHLSQVLFRHRGHSILQADPRRDPNSLMGEETRKPKGWLRLEREQKAQGLGEFSTKQGAIKASQEREDSLRFFFLFIS